MSKPIYDPDQFAPSLQEALRNSPFDPSKLIKIGAPASRHSQTTRPVPAEIDRHNVALVLGEEARWWRVESLASLFRGDRQPPVLGDYPEAYEESFIILDFHALEFSSLFGDRLDEEMLDVYSALRRRPDRRSLGPLHSYMWQAAALMLGLTPLSQAEYEAIVNRLERSCRTFRMGPASRNYIETLRQTIGRQ